MEVTIRQEIPEDHKVVFELVKGAFDGQKYSDGSEHFLVERLRKSNAFIPELSLVAVAKELVVGHILLTKVKIVNDSVSFGALSLAPVSVLPDYQRKGIGGQLINAAHVIAKDLGYKSVVLLGHAKYYPRFGYRKCSDFGISLPFGSADENCMIVELVPDALQGVSGEVVYPPAFYK